MKQQRRRKRAGPATAIEHRDLAALAIAVEHEGVAAQAVHVRAYHRQHRGHRDGSIHGVAAATQHIDARS